MKEMIQERVIAAGLGLSLLAAASPAQAGGRTQENLPAILRFAERYTAEQAVRPTALPAQRSERPRAALHQAKLPSNEVAAQRKADQQRIARQAEQIASLQRALKEASVRPPVLPPRPAAVAIDWSALLQLPQKLRQLAGLSVSEQQAAEKIAAQAQQLVSAGDNARKLAVDRQLLTQRTIKLRAQRDRARHEAKMANGQLENSAKALQEARTQLNLALNQLDLLKMAKSTTASDTQNSPLQQQLRETQEKLAALQKQPAPQPPLSPQAQPEHRLPQVDKAALNNASVRQGYAIGMSLGSEIMMLQKAHRDAGNPVDSQLILAGIIDFFENQPKLNPQEFERAMADVDKSAAKDASTATLKPPVAAVKPVIRQQDIGFLNAYKKRKWAKKSPSGYWYEIIKPGNAAINPSDTVAIVLQEILTNGTMVKDMEKSQKAIRETVSKLPPLFREAVGKLKNQGEMTLVVPPELAYGATGSPPLIPANAVVIYHLRIAGAWPAGKAPKKP